MTCNPSVTDAWSIFHCFRYHSLYLYYNILCIWYNVLYIRYIKAYIIFFLVVGWQAFLRNIWLWSGRSMWFGVCGAPLSNTMIFQSGSAWILPTIHIYIQQCSYCGITHQLTTFHAVSSCTSTFKLCVMNVTGICTHIMNVAFVLYWLHVTVYCDG